MRGVNKRFSTEITLTLSIFMTTRYIILGARFSMEMRAVERLIDGIHETLKLGEDNFMWEAWQKEWDRETVFLEFGSDCAKARLIDELQYYGLPYYADEDALVVGPIPSDMQLLLGLDTLALFESLQ